jgi:hypothetical protein
MMHQQNSNAMHVEESVDVLIRKLENQGKKIKIIGDGDDDEESRSPKKTGRKTRSKAKLIDQEIVEDTKKVEEI